MRLPTNRQEKRCNRFFERCKVLAEDASLGQSEKKMDAAILATMKQPVIS